MKSPPNNHLTFFDDHLDAQYGKRGTPTREEFEVGFEAFKLGAMREALHPKKRRYKRNS